MNPLQDIACLIESNRSSRLSTLRPQMAPASFVACLGIDRSCIAAAKRERGVARKWTGQADFMDF